MELKDADYYDFKEKENTDETVYVVKEKGHGGKGFLIVGLILFLLAATMLAVVFIYAGIGLAHTKEAEEVTYTQAEVDSLVSEAEKTARSETIAEKTTEFAATLFNAANEDAGILNLLRENFPDQVIYIYGTRYEFYPINYDLKQNTIDNADLIKDEETGCIAYAPDGKIKSHKMVDVSSFQKDIDWEAVAAGGVEYAMIRCGFRGYESGKLVEDPYFQANIEGATKAGIKVGVYFFSQALDAAEAAEEAEFTLELIAPYKITLPVAIDVEDVSATARTDVLNGAEISDNSVVFMERIKAAGYDTMIYSNAKYFIKVLEMEKLENYDKWYAFYNDTIYFPYEIAVWQYTNEAYVDGIGSGVDMDITFKEW